MEARKTLNSKKCRRRITPYTKPNSDERNKNRSFRLQKTASGEGVSEVAVGGHLDGSPKCRKCICTPIDLSPVEFPAVWDELRKSRLLCDGTIQSTDGQIFHIHRAILSASSPYFRALFVNSLRKGGEKERTDVSLDVSSNVLQLLLDYVYTGRCDVTHSNVQWLLPAADSFEILGVVQLCCRYLLHEMRPDNSLGIYKFASHYFCHELANKGRRYILHNFKEIVQSSPEFAELTFEELQALLLDDELNARNEEHVFQAAISWVNGDPENRILHLQGLLSCVRFALMPLRFFKESVLQHPYVTNNPQIQQFLYPARLVCSEYDNEEQPKELDTSQLISRPRVPYEVLFAIGGWSAGSPTNFVETYDTRADRWYLSVEMDMTPRAYHGVCALDGLIYMVGGFDGSEHFNTMRSYDPTKGLWSERACMYQARCYVSVCVLGGMVYALGGYNGRVRMASAERYCPKNNQWEMIQSMHKQRSDASAAALNDKVYIAGGFNGQDILNTAEVYDPSTGQWTFIALMNTARSGVSLVAYRGCLYALGGFNGYSRLASAERWDPFHSHQWSTINDMFSPRSNFAAVVLDDMIYVIGGFNGSSTIAFVECYDGDSEEWYDTSPMNLNRSALSACVLAGLPNARDFSYISKVHSGSGSGNNERDRYEHQEEDMMMIHGGDASDPGT